MPAKLLSMRTARVDRFGELCAQRDRARLVLDPVEAEIKALETEIRGWFDQSDPTHVETVRGKLYAVTVGARKLKRTVDTAAAIARLGQEQFNRYATIALSFLDRALPGEQQTGVVTAERSGDRSVSDPILLTSPKAPAKAVA